MFISLPEIHIPDIQKNENSIEIMPVYESIYNKLKNNPLSDTNSLIIPRAVIASEEFASKALQKLSNYFSEQPVKYLADCRSSSSANVPASSYKLLALNSLENTIPFCIQHQGGIELISGLILLKKLLTKNCQALLTTIQKFHNINDRLIKNAYVLADATSSILISNHSNIYANQFQLISTNTFQNIQINITFQNLLISYLDNNNLKIENIDWCIVNNYNEDFFLLLKTIFPKLNILRRKIFSNLNFGVSDIPVSLNLLHKNLKKNSIGILLSISYFNNIGIAIIKSV